MKIMLVKYLPVAFFAVALFFPGIRQAESLDNLNWRSPLSTTQILNRVIFENETFVAVGLDNISSAAGTVVTSKDGVTWIEKKLELSKELFDVAYGNGLWLATGRDNSNHLSIFRSEDAFIWSIVNSGGTPGKGIAFGNDRFVIVGSSGNIITSKDAITWVQVETGPENYLTRVTFGGGIFVAIGQIGQQGIILSSKDGFLWTKKIFEYVNFFDVTYGNGQFIVIGDYNNTITLKSTDGMNWIKTILPVAKRLYGITYGNGIFASVGLDFEGNKKTIITSQNGTDWLSNNINIGSGFYDIAYGSNNTFVIVGAGGTILQSGILGSSITGRVSTNIAGHNDLSIANATVSLEGTNYSTVTDSNGSFFLTDVLPNTYNLIISSPSFVPLIYQVVFSGGSLQLTLPPMTIEQKECLKGDANGDNKLGLEDIIYGLQKITQIR